MVSWRRRLVFRQYFSAKLHTYGIKLYKIGTPEGYMYNLRVYAGKNDSIGIISMTKIDGRHTYKICMDLMKNPKKLWPNSLYGQFLH